MTRNRNNFLCVCVYTTTSYAVNNKNKQHTYIIDCYPMHINKQYIVLYVSIAAVLLIFIAWITTAVFLWTKTPISALLGSL